MRPRRHAGLLAALPACTCALAFALALAGCRERRPPRAELVVLAASSLTDVLSELARSYEDANPEVQVMLSFAGSQALRLQVEQGARADVFASANEDHLEALEGASLAEPPVAFATNELVVVTPRGHASQVSRFSELPRARRLIVGAPSVPLGIYTNEVIARARRELGDDFANTIQANVVSREHNSRLVRAKVTLGDADAAFVYRTDASDSRVQVVEIPPGLNARATYSISPLTASRHPRHARAFAEHVSAARDALRAHGFGAAE